MGHFTIVFRHSSISLEVTAALRPVVINTQAAICGSLVVYSSCVVLPWARNLEKVRLCANATRIKYEAKKSAADSSSSLRFNLVCSTSKILSAENMIDSRLPVKFAEGVQTELQTSRPCTDSNLQRH